MLRSMTGFGRSVIDNADWTQIWEIRSVNGRHLDTKWHLPLQARGLESRFERVLRQFAVRGRVEITLALQQREGSVHLHFDTAQASAMLDAVAALAALHGDLFEPDYNRLFSVETLWQQNMDDSDEELESRLEEGLTAALEDWNESRETEGRSLVADLTVRVDTLKKWVTLIDERAPQVKEEHFAQLRERLTKALEGIGAELDESRFLQEIVIQADKLDVSEELTRLNAHLDRLSELLSSGVDAGRKLDFTLQECFREIATCGNKIQDVQISSVVVDIKNELERCREQVQNLE